MRLSSLERLAARAGYTTCPKRGEIVCGDRCRIWVAPDRIMLALADGLGHGPDAAYAAEAALSSIGARLGESCETLFEECDRELLDTRGVALAIGIIELDSQCATVAAVGNIRSVLLTSGRERRLSGTRGIVGAGYTGLVPQRFELEAGDVLVLFSDGFAEFLPLRDLFAHSGTSMEYQAGNVLRHWASGEDDASILVYRHEAPGD